MLRRSSRPSLFAAALLIAGLSLAGCGPNEGDALSGVSATDAVGTETVDTDTAVVTPAPSTPSAAATAAVPIDPALPDFEPGESVSGRIVSRGSDTMRTVMDYWTEGFKQYHPAVTAEIKSDGSGTAPTALMAGTADIGVMSRPMKAGEIQKFEEKFGYKPLELKSSRDLLAVFVHKDNPVERLTLPQLDAIFSANRELGLEEPIARWGQVGVTGPLAERPISLYGRNSASGTNGFFKDVALGGGDYSDQVKEQAGTSGEVQAVADDPAGIAYGGIGSTMAGVRALPLAVEDGGEYFEPTLENAYSGDYPLSRFLLIYMNKPPEGELTPLQREFLRYVFSREGQEKVVQAGYFPLTAEEAAPERTAAGIEAVASASSE